NGPGVSLAQVVRANKKAAGERRLFSLYGSIASVQLGLYFRKRCLEQFGIDAGIDFVGKHLACRLDSEIHGAAPNFSYGLALGLCDLLLRYGRAARNIVLGALARFLGQHARLMLRRLDDRRGLLLGFLALVLVLGKQCLGFVAQPLGLLQFLPDAARALVE